MSEPVLLFLGLVAVIAFAIVAKRFALPYPIVFVLAGTALAFIPGLPPVQIDPDWVFLAVLPPLLFAGGWSTDWAMFRANVRPILQLAIGLVIVSTAATAVLAEHIVPGLGWAAAFVLGAIVAPPDAVAAIATFERFAVPRRVVTVLDGEGLVNDATALVIYGYAVAAASTGLFAPVPAAVSFVFVAAGGIAVGCAVAWIVDKLARTLTRYSLNDSLIDSLTIIGAAYGAYLGAQAVHASGVLATVAAGILVSRRSSVIYSPETRLLTQNFWTLWIYVLNAFVFLAIGLQLRDLVTADRAQTLALLPAALAISVLLIVVRYLWVVATAVAARWIPPIRRSDPLPPWRFIHIIAWTGMRGIVSLAAALALPYRTAFGSPFPARPTIVFITFVVIFVTLVGQGLSLIPITRWLNIREGGDDGEQREIEIRIKALEGGLRKIAELEQGLTREMEREVLRRLRMEYEDRIEHLRRHLTRRAIETPEAIFDHKAQLEVLHAERRTIQRLRDRGEIPDDIFRKVQYDMDLAEARMF